MTAVDHELLEAVAELRVADLDALIAMNECAVAWRSGDLALARQLASRAIAGFRSVGALAPAHICEGVLAVCGDDSVDPERLLSLLVATGMPRTIVQGAAFAAMANPSLRDACASLVERTVLPETQVRGGRFEFLSAREIAEAVDLRDRASPVGSPSRGA